MKYWLFVGKNEPIKLSCFKDTVQVHVANELQLTKLQNLLFYGYPKGSCFIVPEVIMEIGGSFKKTKIKKLVQRASQAIDYKKFFKDKIMGMGGSSLTF